MLKFVFIVFSLGISSSILFAQDNIVLNVPYDRDTIETKNPMFTWVYLNMGKNNNRDYYRIILVELKKEQSAEAGIIVNQPILKIDPIAGTQLLYPFDAKELEYGHRYGWQIQHIKNNTLVDKSEAWEFTLWKPLEPQPYKYAVLNTTADATIYDAIDGKVFFRFEENHFSETLEYYVYDENQRKMNGNVEIDKDTDGNKELAVTKTNGSNHYKLEMGSGIKPGVYTLIVLDTRKRKYTMKFRVK